MKVQKVTIPVDSTREIVVEEKEVQLTLGDIPEGSELVELDIPETTEPVEDDIQESAGQTVCEEEISTEPNAVISGCAKLNIRKSNSKDSEVLTVLDEGTELFAAETDDDWMVVITAAGIEGYAMKKFIKMK